MSGLLRLAAADFWAPRAYQHIAVADNEGPGNAAKGSADRAHYYKWLWAQNSSPSSTSRPTPHFRSLIFSSPYKDHRRLVIESRPRDGADRGRFSLSRRPLSRGRDRRSGYGVAQFKQAILDFQQ
jgi:hypothetical protein